MNLDEAIAQLIELGEKDPLTIARKIEQREDRDWLAGEMLSLAEDVISDRARQRLNASRRSQVAAIRAGTGVAKAELGRKSLWVPNLLGGGVGGWKPVDDCTPEDFDICASYREAGARSLLVQSGWFREMAGRMRQQGAGTFHEYQGEIPALDSPDEMEAA